MSFYFSDSYLTKCYETDLLLAQENQPDTKSLTSPPNLLILKKISKIRGGINNDTRLSPMMEKGRGGGEIKISASWGGDKDTEVQIGASGNIEDESGNYAKVGISQEISDGK